MSTPEVQTKEVAGACEEVVEKNGWTSFSVNVGSQYPIRLSTKVGAIIEQGRAAGGALATWTFKESQGKENPNRPGTFFTNRYLEKVEAGNKVGPPTAGGSSQGSSSAHQQLQGGDKDRAITRMACLKAACDLYGGTGNTEEAIKAAARLEVWVMRDIDDLPFEGASAATGGQESVAEASQGDSGGMPPPDDGIPFHWIP